MSPLLPGSLIVGCGALANELVALTRHLPNVDITCLPATLHNRPGGIPAAVRDRIRRRRKGYDRVFVAYADCGTGGLLDPVIAEEGVERLAGRPLLRVLRRPRGLRAAQRRRSPGRST